MKQFSKLKFLEWYGLVNGRFNYESLLFEESFKYRLRASLQAFLLASPGLKYYASKFWPKDHLIQLYIGSVRTFDPSTGFSNLLPLNSPRSIYNYLPPMPKTFMASNDDYLLSQG